MSLFSAIGSLSLGATRRSLMVLPPLRYTYILSLLQTILMLPLIPSNYGTTIWPLRWSCWLVPLLFCARLVRTLFLIFILLNNVVKHCHSGFPSSTHTTTQWWHNICHTTQDIISANKTIATITAIEMWLPFTTESIKTPTPIHLRCWKWLRRIILPEEAML